MPSASLQVISRAELRMPLHFSCGVLIEGLLPELQASANKQVVQVHDLRCLSMFILGTSVEAETNNPEQELKPGLN
ncbi:hypothetical protein V6N13_114908 [Hibiscus sabdariffa]